MNQIFLYIALAYLLYYTFHITRDLFFRKKVVSTHHEEIISFEEFQTEDNTIENVSIEDVEPLNVPDAYQKQGRQYFNENSSAEVDIESLREKFENEEDIDEFAIQNAVQEEQQNQPEPEPKSQPIITQETLVQKNQKRFYEMMQQAETRVQLIANYDGQKVYHSTL